MTEERREYLRNYRRQYLHDHPDKRKQWDINRAIALLTRNGYTITAPDPARREEGEQ